MILSAKVSHNNASLFKDILSLYSNLNVRILDLTYGKGVFWLDIEKKNYKIVTVDNYTPADIRADFNYPPFAGETFDVVVFDPPYANQGGQHPDNGITKQYNLQPKNNIKNIVKYYFDVLDNAKFLLKKNGILIIKCQDAVESGKQKLVHVDIINKAMNNFVVEDLFIFVSEKKPMMRHKHQFHARKNHSYFLVFRKKKRKK